MSARRIARELAVIVMPQLPKDKQKLSALDFDVLIAKSVYILVDYARQCLADATALLTRGAKDLTDIEVEHKHNVNTIEDIKSVPLTSAQLREQLGNLELAIEFVSEALDIPGMALHASRTAVDIKCKKCDYVQKEYIEREGKSEVRDFIISLLSNYLDHKEEVDEFIKKAKARWQIERMVSIDRDILRLACTEAFFMPEVPVNVCISEAVELCHRFADEKAARFINGVLGDMSDEAKYFRLHGAYKEPVESSSVGGTMPLDLK